MARSVRYGIKNFMQNRCILPLRWTGEKTTKKATNGKLKVAVWQFVRNCTIYLLTYCGLVIQVCGKMLQKSKKKTKPECGKVPFGQKEKNLQKKPRRGKMAKKGRYAQVLTLTKMAK